MKAVKSLLEAGEFDKELDIDRSTSIEFGKLQEKEQSRNISTLDILIEKQNSVQAEHIVKKETEEN